MNLKGAFLMSQTVARAMKETGGGVIVNLLRANESAHVAVRAARDTIDRDFAEPLPLATGLRRLLG